MSNKYCQALAELRNKSAHELKEVGDQWRTPDLLFWGINAMFGPLTLDLFADDDNAKCPVWYTADDNALVQDWAEMLESIGGAAFGNPPYSRSQYHEKQAITGMTHIMDHTMAMREKGGRYVFLIKAATSETWWPEDADHIMFIRGRIGFDLPVWFVPADNKQKPTGAFFAGAIAIFDKSWRGEHFSYISRTELEEKGKAFMSLVTFAACKAQQAETVQPPAPLTLPEVESRIWPLEVGLVFNQVEGVDVLSEAQQNKLKANINQLWLERTATSEIIAIARGLVGSIARQFGASVGHCADEPSATITAGGGGKSQLVTAFLAKHFGGNYSGPGAAMDAPAHTVTTTDHHAVVTSHLVHLRGTCRDGLKVDQPVPTITAGGMHLGEVRAFLMKYYGNEKSGVSLSEPLGTVTTNDRFGLVTVEGCNYQIVDIGMRMLQPHELYRAQGFPDWYVIDQDFRGNRYAKDKQVARCGNAVPPPFAEALVRANLPELCVNKREQAA
ncbi:phage N-6-adenine-methyltransferase [Salmonella enterica]|nr:phage N-6-adenine-methyltransferase [Salmonella enterica]EBP7484861.1 phage N-6-adenine-methyltransferase [Salmonella enterica subsp. enterica]EBL1688501.1 phage N-6-adenine-methyltransferase [Salmonella enterica]ECS1273861.1 phage N-6-adenine-methyltransferase [Salmonella enterica]EEK8481828.1 phage N-6-adenine-methyltransferase [Salmonella enterica]